MYEKFASVIHRDGLTLAELAAVQELATLADSGSGQYLVISGGLVANQTAAWTVPFGGTGVASLTPYAVISGGVTSTGALQQLSGVGNAGQVLVSRGSGLLPIWQDETDGTPSGVDGDIQYNNGGVFGGFGDFDDATNTTTLPGNLALASGSTFTTGGFDVNAFGGITADDVCGFGADPSSGAQQFIAANNSGDNARVVATYRGKAGQTGNLIQAQDSGSNVLFKVEADGDTVVNNLTVGLGAAGIDYTITVNGETNDGLITWMEDEDYFQFSDDLLLTTTEKIQFRDTAIFIQSDSDGNMLIEADTEVTVNSEFQCNKAITYDAEVDNGNSGTADTIDWGDGNKQKSTLTGNCTYTFTAPNGPCNLILKVVQDGTGSRTVVWPAAVKWPGGTAPTLSTAASDVDIVAFYYDGTSYHGQASLDFS